MTIFERQEIRDKKRTELRGLMDSFGKKKMPDGSEAYDIPADRIGEIRERNDELGVICADIKSVEDAMEAVTDREKLVKAVGPTTTPERKSVLDQIRDRNPDLKLALSGGGVDVDFGDLGREIKSVILTTTGYAPEVVREGVNIPAIIRPPQFIDYLRIVPTTQNASLFMKQTTWTNNVKNKSENQAGEEAAWAYSLVTNPIEDIKGYIVVSERQMDDEPSVNSMIRDDLMLMARQTLDDQVTVGNGTAPNLRGAYNATSVQSQAKGTDPIFDAILKAATKVRVTGRATPNLVLMHSNDFQELVLTRTADGVYILGQVNNSPLRTVWGMPIALSESLTEGNAMVLDTNYLRVRLRQNAVVDMTNAHGEQFLYNNLTLRVTMRAGLEIWRDEAICRVTGV